MTLPQFNKLSYDKQCQHFEGYILKTQAVELRYWEMKLSDAIYSGNKHHISTVYSLSSFYQQYCEDKRSIEFMNLQMAI